MSVVAVNTFTHTAGYLTANLLRSVTDIVKAVGLDPSELPGQALDRGLKAWIESQHLEAVVLEIYARRTDRLIGRFDFDLDYAYSAGSDGRFWLDTDQVSFAIRKAGLTPSGCSYRVVASTRPGRPDVEGWTSTAFRATDGLTRHAVGAAIGAGTSAASVAYYSRD